MRTIAAMSGAARPLPELERFHRLKTEAAQNMLGPPNLKFSPKRPMLSL
jgi:hypothetical protein